MKYFHWNDALLIMHDNVTHLFFKSSYYFPSSHRHTPSPSARLSVCTRGSTSYPFLPHPSPCWLPLLAAHSRVTINPPVAEKHRVLATLSDLILCSIQISWTLPPRNTVPSFHAIILEVSHQPLWPLCSVSFAAPLPLLSPTLFTTCPHFSLVFHEHVRTLKDASDTKAFPHSFFKLW